MGLGGVRIGKALEGKTLPGKKELLPFANPEISYQDG